MDQVNTQPVPASQIPPPVRSGLLKWILIAGIAVVSISGISAYTILRRSSSNTSTAVSNYSVSPSVVPVISTEAEGFDTVKTYVSDKFGISFKYKNFSGHQKVKVLEKDNRIYVYLQGLSGNYAIDDDYTRGQYIEFINFDLIFDSTFIFPENPRTLFETGVMQFDQEGGTNRNDCKITETDLSIGKKYSPICKPGSWYFICYKDINCVQYYLYNQEKPHAFIQIYSNGDSIPSGVANSTWQDTIEFLPKTKTYTSQKWGIRFQYPMNKRIEITEPDRLSEDGLLNEAIAINVTQASRDALSNTTLFTYHIRTIPNDSSKSFDDNLRSYFANRINFNDCSIVTPKQKLIKSPGEERYIEPTTSDGIVNYCGNVGVYGMGRKREISTWKDASTYFVLPSNTSSYIYVVDGGYIIGGLEGELALDSVWQDTIEFLPKTKTYTSQRWGIQFKYSESGHGPYNIYEDENLISIGGNKDKKFDSIERFRIDSSRPEAELNRIIKLNSGFSEDKCLIDLSSVGEAKNGYIKATVVPKNGPHTDSCGKYMSFNSQPFFYHILGTEYLFFITKSGGSLAASETDTGIKAKSAYTIDGWPGTIEFLK